MRQIIVEVLGSNPVRFEWGALTGVQDLESVSLAKVMHVNGSFHFVGGVIPESDVLELSDWLHEAAEKIKARRAKGIINTPSVMAKEIQDADKNRPFRCYCNCCKVQGEIGSVPAAAPMYRLTEKGRRA